MHCINFPIFLCIFSVQILDPQNFEEFPTKSSESLQCLTELLPSETPFLSPEDVPLQGLSLRPHPQPPDSDTQRRFSLQEQQSPLDSRTPQRHSSDPGS